MTQDGQGRPKRTRKPSVTTGSPGSVARSLAADFASQAASNFPSEDVEKAAEKGAEEPQPVKEPEKELSQSAPPAAHISPGADISPLQEEAGSSEDEEDFEIEKGRKKKKPVRGGKSGRGGGGRGRGGGTSGRRKGPANSKEDNAPRTAPTLPRGARMVDLEQSSKSRKSRPPTKKGKVSAIFYKYTFILYSSLCKRVLSGIVTA